MSNGQVIGDRWKIGKTLGRGSFATVKSGTDVTGQLRGSVAIKIFQDVEDEIDLEEIEQEITIMKNINSQYCLKLYDVVVEEESGAIYVVMERAQAELTQRMEDSPSGKLTEKQARVYFSQLMEGLAYLHGEDIIHRDIKFENVMLDANDRVKIGDFGMSKTASIKQQLATRCGSTRYISPEMALMQPGDSYDGRAMDVWSSGVLLFAMLTGALPFPQEALGDMLKAIARGRFTIPSKVSPDARDLISKMMAVDARKRIKVDAIRQHPWLNPPKAPARPQRLEHIRQQSVDAKQNRDTERGNDGRNNKRGKSRRSSATKNVLVGRRSQKTAVDGLKVSAAMVRCIFGLFRKHYRHNVSWKAIKQDEEFEYYLELLGEMAIVRFEKLSDAEWKAMHLNVWNAMFVHVCCERDTHLESLSGGEVQKFFSEEYYQIGPTDRPVSLSGLEARLVEMAKDPRVLFGLCKLTVSSPPLVIFDQDVETQLEEVIRNHCSREVFMDLDKGEMLLPRLFQNSETGRGALKDFTAYNLIRPANQAGLIPWVNDYIPQWKRNELLQMAQTGRKVAVGFRRINLKMLPQEQCRIVAALSLNAPSIKADTPRKGGWCCGGGRPIDKDEQLGPRRRSDSRDLRRETAEIGEGRRPPSLPGSID